MSALGGRANVAAANQLPPRSVETDRFVGSRARRRRLADRAATFMVTAGARPFRIHPDYDTDNVSRKVSKIILSYTDYVNRMVWRKP
jgi:UDP-N-acetylglucosamine 2-epimerase (non-hydrolysing)